jgi:hypothetical protein
VGIPDTVDESFALGAEDTVESVRAAYVAACERSREIAAGRSLDERYAWHSDEVSLRWVLAHMVRELARHAGHGDILVEQLRAARAE